MFDNIFGKLGKRRRVDGAAGGVSSQNASAEGAGAASNLNSIWDHLFRGDANTATATANASASSTNLFDWPSGSHNRTSSSRNGDANNLDVVEDMSIDR